MKKVNTILVVDDDNKQLEMLTSYLEQNGFGTIAAENGADAYQKIVKNKVDMIISDMRMPEMTGMEFYSIIRKEGFQQPILFITAFPDVRDAVNAMRDGAANYLEKPIDLNEMLDSVCKTLKTSLKKEVRTLPSFPDGLIFKSRKMLDLISDAAMIANSDVSVLISGESGTGKEILADLIHSWSPRKEKPFIKINCAAIPENLLESELFGYEKGAFSGASTKKKGLLDEADGGTVMLDEIGEMPFSLQSKLLRVTQDGSFIPLGGTNQKKVDIRLIAATNRDIMQEVQEKRFREDLFYRLSTFEFFIPPLRERIPDIVPLAVHFANEDAAGRKRFADKTTQIMEHYNWPGNIRELYNAVKRAVLLTGGGETVFPEHLPKRILEAVPESTSTDSGEGVLDKMEREMIFRTLEKNNYNRSETARELKMSRRTLTYKIRRYRDAGYDI
jgi:DNA-binding NtrC family response regulator